VFRLLPRYIFRRISPPLGRASVLIDFFYYHTFLFPYYPCVPNPSGGNPLKFVFFSSLILQTSLLIASRYSPKNLCAPSLKTFLKNPPFYNLTATFLLETHIFKRAPKSPRFLKSASSPPPKKCWLIKPPPLVGIKEPPVSRRYSWGFFFPQIGPPQKRNKKSAVSNVVFPQMGENFKKVS